MKILITNDDGCLALGLNMLAKQLSQVAEITVVAPERNNSGVSNSITISRPLRIEKIKENFFSVNGTPSDCIHVALTSILKKKPDLVISGINQGQNLGDDTLFSGTVAAATQAYLFGISAIAFSQVDYNWNNIDSASRVARDISIKQIEKKIGNFLLNVNIPNLKYDKLKKIAITRLGRRSESGAVVKSKDPFGREVFWLGQNGHPVDVDCDTDFFAVKKGWISITPLKIDRTDALILESLKRIF